MCGITAISTNDASSIFNPRLFMKQAALAIEDRGPHATGFAWWTYDDEPFYWKTDKPAHEAIKVAPLDADISVAIGHTRWATQGSTSNNANNHPVIEQGANHSIMLVHNGIIDNEYDIYKVLDIPYQARKDVVDTMVMALLLAHPEEFGSDDPVDLLKWIKGSAAFAWLDTVEPHVLHLARCLMRPLTLGWTRKGDLVMSSTPESLRHLSKMAGIKIRKFREVAEGTYLKVLHGEIIEERSFEPTRRTTYSYGSSGSSVPQATTVVRSLPAASHGGGYRNPLSDDEWQTEYDRWWAERDAESKRYDNEPADLRFWVDRWSYVNTAGEIVELGDRDELADVIDLRVEGGI